MAATLKWALALIAVLVVGVTSHVLSGDALAVGLSAGFAQEREEGGVPPREPRRARTPPAIARILRALLRIHPNGVAAHAQLHRRGCTDKKQVEYDKNDEKWESTYEGFSNDIYMLSDLPLLTQNKNCDNRGDATWAFQRAAAMYYSGFDEKNPWCSADKEFSAAYNTELEKKNRKGKVHAVCGKRDINNESNGCNEDPEIKDIYLTGLFQGKGTSFIPAQLFAQTDNPLLWKQRIISALLHNNMLVVGIGCCDGKTRAYSSIIGFRAQGMENTWKDFTANFKTIDPINEQSGFSTQFQGDVKKNKYIETKIRLLMLESHCDMEHYAPRTNGDCRIGKDQKIYAASDSGKCKKKGQSMWDWKCLKEVDMQFDREQQQTKWVRKKCMQCQTNGATMYWSNDETWYNEDDTDQPEHSSKVGCAPFDRGNDGTYEDEEEKKGEGYRYSYITEMYAIPFKTFKKTTA